MVKSGGGEDSLAITGGFIEVRPDRVIVLADAAERAEEIDTERAEAARKRAQERLDDRKSGLDNAKKDKCEKERQKNSGNPASLCGADFMPQLKKTWLFTFRRH